MSAATTDARTIVSMYRRYPRSAHAMLIVYLRGFWNNHAAGMKIVQITVRQNEQSIMVQFRLDVTTNPPDAPQVYTDMWTNFVRSIIRNQFEIVDPIMVGVKGEATTSDDHHRRFSAEFAGMTETVWRSN